MNTEDTATPQVAWSPADLPEQTAKALQDKEEARRARREEGRRGPCHA